MNQAHLTGKNLSVIAKIGYGILCPEIVFVAYQLILIGSTSGTGSWDGMSLFFGSIFMVPGLLVTNCWVVLTRWDRAGLAFLAGLAIPAAIGAVEYFWLFGFDKIRWAINSAMVAPFPWVWLFGTLLFAPLLISTIYAIRRRFHGDKT